MEIVMWFVAGFLSGTLAYYVKHVSGSDDKPPDTSVHVSQVMATWGLTKGGAEDAAMALWECRCGERGVCEAQHYYSTSGIHPPCMSSGRVIALGKKENYKISASVMTEIVAWKTAGVPPVNAKFTNTMREDFVINRLLEATSGENH